MIVTRSWLEKYIDLEGVSNQELYETFNRIGLEVDSLKEYSIPSKIVVGRIVACDRHPDADKLSLCRIDIGDGEPRQIVCGAANVSDAEYVAVATVGAVLPDGMEIKPARLRGVESFGMVCSAEELGLPRIHDGIMILDESIGELEVGRELNTYPRIADTVIELELTANRGDCLSIHGVARDLSAALDRPIKERMFDGPKSNGVGIARKLKIQVHNDVPADLVYFLSSAQEITERLIIRLRLAFAGIEPKNTLEGLLQYTTHTTGVILQAYDARKLYNAEGKIRLDIRQVAPGEVAIVQGEQTLSTVGVAVDPNFIADDASEEILFEASYIDPTMVVEAVATRQLKSDPFYYHTSRGSEPRLDLGIIQLEYLCDCVGDCVFYEGNEVVKATRQKRTISANTESISAIIGDTVSKSVVYTILKRLGFEIYGAGEEAFGVRVPPHRHDIVNLHDLTEEVLRMVGIDNIRARRLTIIEANRLTGTTRLHRAKRDLRQKAVAAGFYETITYAFTDRSTLEKYGFPLVKESLEVANPIVEELNTLRTTLLTNLLDALKRNVSYGIKRIALFEIGTVFDADRNESERIAFVWSGHKERESIVNHGKPPAIDFAAFVESISRVIGDVELRAATPENGLMHPYQAAQILRNGQPVGIVTRLHPAAAKAYGLPETYLACMDLGSVLPGHQLARPVSNYQAVVKDISVLVDKRIPYSELAAAIASAQPALLKRYYAIDLYEDAALGDAKSVTIRLVLQSDTGTLSDEAIEESVSDVLAVLEDRCQARLR